MAVAVGRFQIFRALLKVLAVAYLVGAFFHLMDLLDLRLRFSEMNTGWKVWIIYLFVADALAAIGLWGNKTWGILIFLMIASSQLIAYTLFSDFFGLQVPLILFHLISLSLFLLFGGIQHLRQGG